MRTNKIIKSIATTFVFLLSTSSFATEGGGGAYPNGAEDFMSGAVPPPGMYYLNYLTHYSADSLKDNSGNNIGDFKLNATANVSRFVYVSDTKLFGANWGGHILVPIATVDGKLTINPGPGTVFNERDSGLGDITVNPIILSWHSKNLHQVFGLDITLPTGGYDSSKSVNVGRNYYTFEAIYGATYLSDEGFETSGKFMYDVNMENRATNYKSGDEFHFDYTLGKHIGKELAVGVGGYYYKQITDDKQNGSTIENNKGQVFAVGPQIQYNIGKLSLIAKYQVETNAKNKPEGNKAWFKLIYPL